MRKLLVIAASVFLLTAGAAFAQEDETALDVAPDGDSWVGASTGYPLGLTAHYGLGDALGDGIDLRFNGKFYFLGVPGISTFSGTVGADALFNIPVDADDLSVYAGAGPSVGFTTGNLIGGLSLGAQGLAGAEYLVTEEIGLFGEFRLGVGFVTGSPIYPDLNFAFGANYHF